LDGNAFHGCTGLTIYNHNGDLIEIEVDDLNVLDYTDFSDEELDDD